MKLVKVVLLVLSIFVLTASASAAPNSCSSCPTLSGNLETSQSFPGPTGSGNIGSQTISLGAWELQVGSIGAPATSWTVVLEGSTDGGAHWGPILSHTKSVNGEYGFKVGSAFGLTDYRANITELTLGAASGLSIKIFFKLT